jgi:ABC-2 type transport system permease protein
MRGRTFAFFTWAVVRYTLRDRVAAFFVFLMPFAIIGLLGVVLSSGTSRPLGVVSDDHGPWAQRLIAQLSHDRALTVGRYRTLAELRTAVREEHVGLGLQIPASFDAALDGHGGADAVFVVEREELVPAALRLAVLRDLNTVTAMGLAARYDVSLGHLSPAAAAGRAISAASAGTPGLRAVQASQPAAAALSGVAYAAPGNLVLFILLNVVGTASGLVAIRQFGVSRRMLSTATGPWLIALSEGAGRVALGMVQALVIIVVTALAYGVRWGPPAAVLAIVFLVSAIGAALALITSAVSATPQQAFVLAPAIMLTAAMLGGCLWPLSAVGPALRMAGRLFPPWWAMDALLRLRAPNGNAREIMLDGAVLTAFAIVLAVIAVPLYRRRIATG